VAFVQATSGLWHEAHAVPKWLAGGLWHEEQRVEAGCVAAHETPGFLWHAAHDTLRTCPDGGLWHEEHEVDVWRNDP
jgi:hypothetical protein